MQGDGDINLGFRCGPVQIRPRYTKVQGDNECDCELVKVIIA